VNNVQARWFLTAEFLSNQKSFPEQWTQEYDIIVDLFIKKSTSVPPEDKLIETDFFRQPKTLMQLIVLNNIPQSHYSESIKLLSNEWQPWIDRAKLISFAHQMRPNLTDNTRYDTFKRT
jgi:hypothetical protein